MSKPLAGIDPEALSRAAVGTLAKAAQSGDVRAAAALLTAIEKIQPLAQSRDIPEDRAEHLRRLLTETEEALFLAREAGSWQAVAALTRQVVKLRDDLDATTEREAAPVQLTEAEAMAELQRVIVDLPPHERRELADLITGAPALRVIEGDG